MRNNVRTYKISYWYRQRTNSGPICLHIFNSTRTQDERSMERRALNNAQWKLNDELSQIEYFRRKLVIGYPLEGPSEARGRAGTLFSEKEDTVYTCKQKMHAHKHTVQNSNGGVILDFFLSVSRINLWAMQDWILISLMGIVFGVEVDLPWFLTYRQGGFAGDCTVAVITFLTLVQIAGPFKTNDFIYLLCFILGL